MMRKLVLIGALAAGCLAAGPLMTSAEAMPISAPAAAKVAGSGNLSEVAYVCRRVWTRWGWRRSCWWRPGGYYRHGYYGWRRPYGYYGWRHRYYRRHWY
jgi:hypothetical protein